MKIIKEIINNLVFKNNFYIIGIDGPTASGKTTLADNMAEKLKENGIPVFIYRLDWCLIDRDTRLEDLNQLLNLEKPFEYEADLHMDLNKAADFLSEVNYLRNKEINKTIVLHLEKLYNRSDDGKCTGKEVVALNPKMVIIVEGHYTHHPKIRKYIDYNILLVAGTKQLLHRKAQRIKSYRDNDTVTKYFNLVDLPSFNHYFSINIPFFDKILLNETFETQPEVNIENVIDMYNINSNNNPTSVDDFIIPATTKTYQLKTKELNDLLIVIKNAHEIFIKLWGIHPSYKQESHSEILNQYLNKININAEYSVFYLTDANKFRYEYGIISDDRYYLITGNLKSINLSVFASYTHRYFKLSINHSGNKSNKQFKLINTFKPLNNKLNIICPNGILVPDFLQKYNNISFKYYNKDSEFQKYIHLFYYNKVFFVGRMHNIKQHEFYKAAYAKIGFYVTNSGNYIFISNFCKTENYEDFKNFEDNFGSIGIKHNNEISLAIKNQLINASCIVSEDSIFIPPQVNKSLLIETYKKSDIKTKNLITRSLCRQYGDVEIFENIKLKEYIAALPVSLNELYFALSISQKGMLSYYSIFNPSVPSIDIQSYFNHYVKNKTAFGLQASLNALGINNTKGYLGINGPIEFAQIIKENLLQFLSNNKECIFPPWSLGIDHINDIGTNYTNSKLLVKQSLETGMIKSFCIDTSNLIKDELEQTKFLFKEYLQNLLHELKSGGNDIELYVGHENVFANLDFEKSIEIYKVVSSIFKDYCLQYKLEPYALFGPFLGTKHHKANGEINPNYSERIFNELSKYNLIGNVLHGTSYVPFKDIRNLKNRHCVRINFAGKFLDAIINNLPEAEQSIMGNTQYEWKQNLSNLNISSVNSSQTKIIKDFKNTLNQISEFELNKMSYDEINWFRNNQVSLPENDLELLINKLTLIKSSNTAFAKDPDCIFVPSMIEVPFVEFAGGLVNKLYVLGLKHFHIDIGDGSLISRTLDGYEKLKYLSQKYPDTITHVHLMIKDIFGNSGSLIEKISKIKTSIIYFHLDSLSKNNDIKFAANLIKSQGNHAGVVLTVENNYNMKSILSDIKEADIHNILLMGVPIGRGGQSFVDGSLQRLKAISEWAERNNFKLDIEVDGGLNDYYLRECITRGAKYLSGWSYFLKYSTNGLEERINELKCGKF
jgi:ribulose-phosphate 3-epimerase